MLALALRQSIRQQPMEITRKLKIPDWDDHSVRGVLQDAKGPLFQATTHATRLDDVSTETYHAAPDDLARLGFAMAAAIRGTVSDGPQLPKELSELAHKIATALGNAQRPVVVAGTTGAGEAIVRAAANVAWALAEQGRSAGLSYVLPESDSLGLTLLGGEPLEEAIRAVEEGQADTVIVLENDLYRRAPVERVDRFVESAKHLIVLDYLENRTTARGDIVLPSAPFAESDGTLVNNEGRAQRYYQIYVPTGDVQESWRWLRDLTVAARGVEAMLWQTLDDVVAALATEVSELAPVTGVAPPASFRINGQKVPRQPARYSGRTAMLANINVSEPKPPDDPDSPLSFSMEGTSIQPPGALVSHFWAPGWNSIQALNKFQDEIAGPLRGGDPGRRLIEPGGRVSGSDLGDAPAAFSPRSDDWLLVGIHHIFGSEELSVLTPGIAERAPQPYLALGPDDAGSLGVENDEQVVLELAGTAWTRPLRILPSLPPGVAGLPVGVSGDDWVALPAWARIERASLEEDRAHG